MHASLLDGPRGDEGRPCGRQAGISTPALEGLQCIGVLVPTSKQAGLSGTNKT